VSRREFIALLGGATAWPLAARAQQPSPALIGFFKRRSPMTLKQEIDAFRDGLRRTLRPRQAGSPRPPYPEVNYLIDDCWE
jgi:hypothetical protein